MKKIFYLFNSMLMLLLITSCDNEEVTPVAKGIAYTFDFKMSLETKNRTLIPDDGYSKNNIFLKYENGDEIPFEVHKWTDYDPVLKEVFITLDMVISGEFDEKNPFLTIILQCGTTPKTTTIDTLKFELENIDANISHKKIWVNNKLESQWGMPIRIRRDINVPPAEPLNLKYPKKIESDNHFALNLFKKAIISSTEKNEMSTFISPLSVNIALSMLVNGAEGATKEEIIKTLEAEGFSIEQINEHLKELCDALTSVDQSTTITIANSIWSQTGFPIKSAFIQANNNYYDAEVKDIDFSSSDAVSIINRWCAEKTNNKIPNAVDYLSNETIMALINALYFESNWFDGFEFNESLTSRKSFHTADNSTEEVDMMHSGGNYLYKSDSHAGYLKIPFGNSAYSMTIILPNEGRGIQEVVDNMYNDLSWTTSDNMKKQLVVLSLPKFKKDFSYEMKDILRQMGMSTPFIPLVADFSRISDNSEIYVNRVIHKTSIEVDENGVAAAAVTIIMMEAEADGPGEAPPKPIEFNVNKPFIFSINEESTGSILFIGNIGKISE